MRTISFKIPGRPVSVQAIGSLKKDYQEKVKSAISSFDFFISGEVFIRIEWMIHDRIRYETDEAPDVDNILKPLLDGLVGPQGILIDDSQIQSVQCSWIDWTLEEQEVNVFVEFLPDEIIESKDIFFVQFDNGLCFPFDNNLPQQANVVVVEYLLKVLEARQELFDLSNDHYASLRVMPTQRFFHRTRLGKRFKIRQASEFENKTGS